jgi:hypothetical protein
MWYYSPRIPWVYGGEYDQFAAVIKWTVEAWLRLGINLSFVFDGEEGYSLVLSQRRIPERDSRRPRTAEVSG